jgi:FkbH-like protein
MQSGMSPRIVVAASFTAEPVANSLKFWLDYLDLKADIAFAPAYQVFQQLLDPSSVLRVNRKGTNVVCVRPEDLGVDKVSACNRARELAMCANNSAAASGVPHLLLLCPPSSPAIPDPAELESILDEQIGSGAGVFLVRLSELMHLYPVSNCLDTYSEQLGNIPYTAEFLTALGTIIARKLWALSNPSYKAIVVDCDQTLWQGRCGEDGVDGIAIEKPELFLQNFLLERHQAGMLLCMCSKNAEQDILEVFRCRRDMLLKLEHFTAWRVNWRPKSENLLSLASQLQLGLDAFIFIDDDALECEEVAANCPDILTLKLPEGRSAIPKFLEHIWAFDMRPGTTEAGLRTKYYRDDDLRKQVSAQALTIEDFIDNLNVRIDIRGMSEADSARVSELTRRTNQFNFSGIRRTEAEVVHVCKQQGMQCFIVSATDRFGDYGNIGTVLFSRVDGALTIDTFVVSCRALGRRIEYHMLAAVAQSAQRHGIEQIIIPFRQSSRNQPAFEFLETIGATYKRPSASGWTYEIPCQEILSKDTVFELCL